MIDMEPVFDGPEEAPVLVLGPSLGTDIGLFDAQVAEFAGRFRVAAFNLPGHGGAPSPEGPYSVAALAQDVLAMLNRYGIDRFHYAGVSIGGAIGLQLALEAGERMSSLTVCASAARFANPESWPARAATVRADGTEAMLASRPGTWYTHEFARAEPAEAERLLDMLRATTREGYAGCCEAIGAFDVRQSLGEIRVPTLLLAGAEDPATPPEMLRQIADGIPGSRLVVVPDTAHLPVAEAPETVNGELGAHLAGSTSGAGRG